MAEFGQKPGRVLLAIPVTAGTVAIEDVPVLLHGIGTVQAYNTVAVKSRVDGQIVKINFKEGQEVKVGDPLFQIDPRPYQSALELAQSAKEKDEATLAGAQLDLDIDQFRHVMQDFGNALQGADVGLFYYAGHGIQVHGANYLVPVGANPSRESDVDLQMLDSNVVLRQMEGAGTKLSMMLLDACRNNPFGGRGLRAARWR